MKFLIGFICGAICSALFFLFFLKNEAKNPPSEMIGQSTLTESNADFEAFYEKFHGDSIFQIEHIIFPLDGLPANADSATFANGNFKWSLNSWVMHKKFDPKNNEYSLERSELGDGMIIEQIKDQSGQYGIQRRFAKMGNDWFLIYYAGMNRLAPE